MQKTKKDIIFAFLCIIIIVAVASAVIYQFRRGYCTQQKGAFIKQNLPEVYGPTVTIEQREADAKRINTVYNNCLYFWK